MLDNARKCMKWGISSTGIVWELYLHYASHGKEYTLREIGLA